MRRSLFLVLALASASAWPETYRWVDPASGRTVISDTPPPPTARAVSRAGNDAGGEPSQPFAVRRAAAHFPVTLYTAADCETECRQARELLTGRGIPFAEKKLEKPQDAEELKKLVGDPFVPSLQVGRESVRGFRAEAYHQLLDLAGYPSRALPGASKAGATP